MKDYDYSENGAYFIKIYTKSKQYMLCKNNVGANSVRSSNLMELSDFGMIVEMSINNISNHYKDVIVDKYIIMPNHIHIILL